MSQFRHGGNNTSLAILPNRAYVVTVVAGGDGIR